MKRLVLGMIRLYQRTFPLHIGLLEKLLGASSTCRFTPTCSEYTMQAVEKYGSLKGLGMGMRRFLRCHPYSKGGFDPVK